MILDEAVILQSLCSRHGTEFAAKMRQTRVAIAGLGGLGSNIAVALVRMGIQNLHLIDYDKVDLSNLNRQQYVLKDIGKYKTEALQGHLLEINPFIKLKIDCLRLNADNMAGIFAEDDIICEALDAAESKALLVNTIMTGCADKKIVAASGMAGLGSANDITTKKLNNRLYICGDGKSDCTDMSLTAARAAICAGHQAQTVCRIILGLE